MILFPPLSFSQLCLSHTTHQSPLHIYKFFADMLEKYTSHHPSFSSTLLDSIYRSIDEGEEGMNMMKKKYTSFPDGAAATNVRRGVFKSDEEMANFKRACMIEKWMDKKVTEKVVVVQRKSVTDLQVKKQRKDRGSSSWSSSDSSGNGGFFSSSEAESFPARRPKPIRTGIDKEKSHNRGDFELGQNRRELGQNQKSEGGFSKTKLRALKIYGDLKKVKQPISPGGKLAGILNALFSGGKQKVAGDDSKSTNASTCSSASSFSRSCLSKTPSSRGKPSAVKRSVRFSPVSVIVDEDLRPCGHKSLHPAEIKIQKSNLESGELMAHVMEKNRRVEEAARDLLRNYQRKNQNQNQNHQEQLSIDQHLRKSHVDNRVYGHDFDEDDDDEDAASCASSDLFELDNLSAIGMERYREELPVYETTRLDSTLANGMIF